MTKDEQRRAIAFQDAVGEIVDESLREGMTPELIASVLRDEAGSAAARKLELDAEAAASHSPKGKDNG